MHTLGQGKSRDGPIGTLGRSGRRLRTNRSAAVLGCCKNLRLGYAMADNGLCLILLSRRLISTTPGGSVAATGDPACTRTVSVWRLRTRPMTPKVSLAGFVAFARPLVMTLGMKRPVSTGGSLRAVKWSVLRR